MECHICGSSLDLKACAACQCIWYCSRKCQKNDWKRHKQECCLKQQNDTVSISQPVSHSTASPPVNVANHNKLDGQKALYAVRDFELGEEIFCELPLLTIPDAMQSNDPFFCQYVRAFLSLPKPQKELLLQLQEADIFFGASNVANPQFVDPQSPVQKLQKETFLAGIAKSGISLPSQEEKDEAWKFLRIWNSNCFAFGDAEQAVFQILSRANHSCSPNVLRREHEDGSRMRCVAACPIKAGEELTVSYVMDAKLMKLKSLRKKKLSDWGFNCKCLRCNEEKDDMRSFKCSITSCNGFGYASDEQDKILPCECCGTSFSTKVRTKLFQQEHRLEAEYLDMERNTTNINSIEPLLDLFQRVKTSGVGDFHWLVAAIADLAADFAVQGACRGQIPWSLPCEFYETILAFWNKACPRLSLRKSFIQEKFADILTCENNFDRAGALYEEALVQQRFICGSSSTEVDCIRKKMGRAMKRLPNTPDTGCCIQ
mmetsp:Transcript_28569/g.37408  ORF Transcript_28569/g.37408 Transcript_28569/m.37408 type:complete len:486 (-) Transcript_28569:222-1679(-)